MSVFKIPQFGSVVFVVCAVPKAIVTGSVNRQRIGIGIQHVISAAVCGDGGSGVAQLGLDVVHKPFVSLVFVDFVIINFFDGKSLEHFVHHVVMVGIGVSDYSYIDGFVAQYGA